MSYPLFLVLSVLFVAAHSSIVPQPVLLGGYHEIAPEKFKTIEQSDPSFALANREAHRYMLDVKGV